MPIYAQRDQAKSEARVGDETQCPGRCSDRFAVTTKHVVCADTQHLIIGRRLSAYASLVRTGCFEEASSSHHPMV